MKKHTDPVGGNSTVKPSSPKFQHADLLRKQKRFTIYKADPSLDCSPELSWQ